MSVAHIFAQPDGSTDISALLLAKQPLITVDSNGGWFPLSAGCATIHALVSGDDRAPDRTLVVQWLDRRYPAHAIVYPT